MPLHDYSCSNCGSMPERYTSLDKLDTPLYCSCGTQLERVFLKAPAGHVQRDICYDSPIDGRPITTRQARAEDLARNGCIPYEPGMKQDTERNKLESDRQLDRAVDSSVDQFFATAPVRKREKLEQELRAGVTVEPTRASPAQP